MDELNKNNWLQRPFSPWYDGTKWNKCVFYFESFITLTLEITLLLFETLSLFFFLPNKLPSYFQHTWFKPFTPALKSSDTPVGGGTEGAALFSHSLQTDSCLMLF